MNHRRLRLPAAMAVVALAAPVFAADPGQSPSESARADIQTAAAHIHSDARDLGNSVREGTRQVHDQVAHSVHQFRHQFTIQWYRTGDSIHRWWNATRDGFSRS
jgi:hypothetical protein